MATRSKDTIPPGKEKRGTSPSPMHHGRSSTNTSKTTSPVRKQADQTTTSNKNIPSYLKPTIAQSKKSASSSDLHNINNNKTSLARRRSFDNKPPLPSSSSPKTRISPNPRERIPRSSSLSAKTSTSQKPLVDKLSKTSKDALGKQRGPGLNSRPVTKKKTITTTTTKKHDSINSSTTKASVITNAPDMDQNVISQGEQSEPEDHQELTIHETEKEMIVSDGEVAAVSDAGDNDSAMDEHEELNGNVNNTELEDIKAAAESSSIVVENQEIEIEEPEENLQIVETQEISNEPDEHDSSEKEKEEIAINESEETQESKKENEGINQEKEAAIIEATEAEPEKNTNVESLKPQTQVVQGKNKESVVSNNVIEETASKLREQRKNRVKALAGAFETVISLQEHK